ncbi:3-phosphoshikimate 1-carboxyvinyltransferase [Halomonas denitrificans]|nr:3-phosphoshikimate 1-carboxyvinyltransferase [Halomonas denitrificans]
MRLRVHPARGPLAGEITPPGDKSISHRAALFGGLADGETEIVGFLEGEDTRATLAAMQALGAEVERRGDRILVRGGRLHAPNGPLDLGNAGTGIRLLTGALAGRPELRGAELVLTGDASLRARPMARIVEPLTRMGASIESTAGCAPLTVRPRALTGGHFELGVASAQVKSALLLAGLSAEGRTEVVSPAPSRDHTERLLPAFGVDVDVQGLCAALQGPAKLTGTKVTVPGDLSSATFPLIAALLVPGSRILLRGVGINPTRDGVLQILAGMVESGAVEVRRVEGGAGDEPVADLEIRSLGPVRGLDISPELVPLAIDEFPALMALAAVAAGTTRIRGAEELRVKESDRIAVMTTQLRRLGVEVEEAPDGATIVGGAVRAGRVDAAGDHRVAMSLAVLGLVAEGPVEIDGADWIATSYPGFVDDLRALGAEVEVENEGHVEVEER